MTTQADHNFALALRDKVLSALGALGWSRAGERNVYQAIREAEIRHVDRMAPYSLEREYGFECYGEDIVGKAVLDSTEVERIAEVAAENRRSMEVEGRSNWMAQSVEVKLIFIVPEGRVRHPHANNTNSCMTLATREMPQDPDLAAADIATAITMVVEVIDLTSALNGEWGVCGACETEGLVHTRTCGECDHSYCRECWDDLERHPCREEPEAEDEPEDGPAEDDPEALPDWRDRREDSAPRLASAVGTCFLVGCGVTGSWVAPVLMRSVQRLTILDPDVVDERSPHGLWMTGQGPKLQGVPFGRYSVRGLTLMYRGQQARADLFVLCPDSAQARMALDGNEADVKQVLDIRATPTGLTVWAMEDGSQDETWRAWRQSLQGYVAPEACHHDNVPIKAGTLAAAFVAWWMTSGRPSGLWNIPYGYEGMPFGPAAQEGGERG